MIDVLSCYTWRDSYLSRIVIEDNKITIKTETDSGGIKNIVFINYIAIEYIGQWDECVIDNIFEDNSCSTFLNSMKKIQFKDSRILGDGTRKKDSDWHCITVKLIDDVCINIVCNDIEIVDRYTTM